MDDLKEMLFFSWSSNPAAAARAESLAQATTAKTAAAANAGCCLATVCRSASWETSDTSRAAWAYRSVSAPRRTYVTTGSPSCD